MFEEYLAAGQKKINEEVDEYILAFFGGDRETVLANLHLYVLEFQPMTVAIDSDMVTRSVLELEQIYRLRKKTDEELEAERMRVLEQDGEVFWELVMDMYDSPTPRKSLGHYRTLQGVQEAEREALEEQEETPGDASGQIYFIEHRWKD